MKMPSAINSTPGYIILGVVLAFAINFALAFGLSTSMPIVAVESNSMVPTFYKGDILVLQGVPGEQLVIGDIIVFSPTGGTHGPNSVPIVHRIIKINDDSSFQTKGDANPGQLAFEKHIEVNQIHGKSIMIIPYLGWVKIGIAEYVMPNIIWIIIIVIIVYLIFFVVKKHIKRHRTIHRR